MAVIIANGTIVNNDHFVLPRVVNGSLYLFESYSTINAELSWKVFNLDTHDLSYKVLYNEIFEFSWSSVNGINYDLSYKIFRNDQINSSWKVFFNSTDELSWKVFNILNSEFSWADYIEELFESSYVVGVEGIIASFSWKVLADDTSNEFSWKVKNRILPDFSWRDLNYLITPREFSWKVLNSFSQYSSWGYEGYNGPVALKVYNITNLQQFDFIMSNKMIFNHLITNNNSFDLIISNGRI